jgi:hypothetical protein
MLATVVGASWQAKPVFVKKRFHVKHARRPNPAVAPPVRRIGRAGDDAPAVPR